MGKADERGNWELCSLSWIVGVRQQSWISWIMGQYNKVSEATAAVALVEIIHEKRYSIVV